MEVNKNRTIKSSGFGQATETTRFFVNAEIVEPQIYPRIRESPR